jgi:hypothetical protein
MSAIIHKKGKQTATSYVGFGQYAEIPSPLCVGAKMLYKGYEYLLGHYWKDVTCNHCLKRKNTQ